MERTDFYEELLSALLDCGTADISIISDCGYDMDEIVEITKEEWGDVRLENLTYTIIEHGLNDLEHSIETRIRRIKDEYPDLDELMDGRDGDEYEEYIGQLDDAGELSMEQFKDMDGILRAYRELDALEDLNVRMDTEYSFNYLATYVYFLNNEEIYREYCKDMLDEFERNTGFSL